MREDMHANCLDAEEAQATIAHALAFCEAIQADAIRDVRGIREAYRAIRWTDRFTGFCFGVAAVTFVWVIVPDVWPALLGVLP